MHNRKLFYKTKSIKFYFFIFLLIPISIFIHYIFFTKKDLFYIPEYQNSYYQIPDDKGGKKISNLDKKVLHYNDKDFKNSNYSNDPILNYSIQIFTSSNYENVKNHLNLQISDKSVKKSDFSIAIFRSNLIDEYMLLYKNFENRDDALSYCKNNLYIKINCLIVNVKNLN